MSEWKEYRKVTTIKAVQVSRENYQQLADEVFRLRWPSAGSPPNEVGCIHTLEGSMTFTFGDWIAEGINGERWPIKREIFQKTYAEVKYE